MTQLTAKVPKKVREDFEKKCKDEGLVQSIILERVVNKFIDENYADVIVDNNHES